MKWAIRNSRFACHLGGDYAMFGGRGRWGPATLTAIERSCARCDFSIWRLWGRDNVFYEMPGVLVQVSHAEPGDEPDLYASARTRAALAGFEQIVRDTGFRWDAGSWFS